MMILLNSELNKIVERDVKFYKTDLLKDLQVLLDKNRETNVFIFFTRECGTNMYEKDHLYVKEAFQRIDFEYFYKQSITVYEIEVLKRGRENIYGTIKQIELNDLLEDIKSNEVSCSNAEVKIVKKDGTVKNCIFSTKIEHYESLRKNGINYEDVQRSYYLRYL